MDSLQRSTSTPSLPDVQKQAIRGHRFFQANLDLATAMKKLPKHCFVLIEDNEIFYIVAHYLKEKKWVKDHIVLDSHGVTFGGKTWEMPIEMVISGFQKENLRGWRQPPRWPWIALGAGLCILYYFRPRAGASGSEGRL